MTIDRHDLIDGFGQALLEGTGALFIGAGMSLNAGLPNWADLLKDVRSSADVPEMSDLPLMAEYIMNSPEIGRGGLDAAILDQVAGPFPLTDAHDMISALPAGEIWTTNYDRLLEQAYAGAAVVDAEDRIHLVGSKSRTVIKMHGSVDASRVWTSPPVVTRTDYENYPIDRPRTWAVLQGSYLSRTMLFLGFSFTDPNVEVLLKLARRYGRTTGRSGLQTRHMTVLRRPDGSDAVQLRRHTLQVADLERSGVRVHEIDDFGELGPLLSDLVRRTRPQRAFISGSRGSAKVDLGGWTGPLAIALADHADWELTSLGGEAAWELSKQVAEIRKAESKYDPDRIRFSFRRSTSHAPAMDSRVGTAVYTDLTREQLVTELLNNCRALLAIHGADRTEEEIDWARERGVGVIPLAASGGAAKAYWEAQDPHALPKLGGQDVDPAVWRRLDDASPAIATRAAMELLAQAMYDRPTVV
ncbi:MAG TPA: SIR2 family protein [Nakamurella sp.]